VSFVPPLYIFKLIYPSCLRQSPVPKTPTSEIAENVETPATRHLRQDHHKPSLQVTPSRRQASMRLPTKLGLTTLGVVIAVLTGLGVIVYCGATFWYRRRDRKARKAQTLPVTRAQRFGTGPESSAYTARLDGVYSGDGPNTRPDLRRPLPQVPSSRRLPNAGPPVGNPPPLPPTENKNTDSSSTLSSSGAPHSEVTQPSRSYVATLRPETASYLLPVVDANSPSHGPSQTTARRLSRRCSEPLGSPSPSSTTLSCPNTHPNDAETSFRWPFLGHVRTDLVSANSALNSESCHNPYWVDWMEKGRPKTASGSDSNEHDIHRYYADPGPRAPRPGQLHDVRELTAPDVEVKELSSKVTDEDHAIRRYHADP
jgi:hypothetical protein